MSTFSEKLKQLRKDCGLSVNEVIEQLNIRGVAIGVKAFYHWESGRRMPDADEFLELCEIYGVENFAIFDETEKAPASEEAEARESEIAALEAQLGGLLTSLGVHPDELTADQADFLIHTVALIKAYFKK